MNDADATKMEEELTPWLVACDEALARGAAAPSVVEAQTPAELKHRQEQNLACLRLLHEVFPRRAGSPESVQAASLPASSLGRFLLRKEIGRGAFGIVLLAFDPILGREVALKVPRPEILVTPDLRDRFLLEAKAAAGLDHPNIVPVHEAGQVGAICYIASAYCPGTTLAEWLRNQPGPVPPRTAAELLIDLAEAIQHAHSRGVIHRDLKPTNIMLDGAAASPASRDGRATQEENRKSVGSEDLTVPRATVPLSGLGYPEQQHVDPGASAQASIESGSATENSRRIVLAPGATSIPVAPAGPFHPASVPDPLRSDLLRLVPRVTDFGLAKVALQSLGDSEVPGALPTRTGAVLGTPNYMAPEQASGRSKDVGPAADIYSLGAILYEVLTGRPPFRGETTLDTLEQVRSQEPLAPRRLRPRLPRDLETICLKCLQKDARRRYATSGALAQDLRSFLDGRPIAARPVSVWERGWKWARRRPAWAALIAVTTTAAVAFFLLVALHDRQLRLTNERLSKALDDAAENFRLARQSVDDFSTKVSEDERLKGHDLEKLRTELLQSAAAFYRRFTIRRGDDPEVESERGQALMRLAFLSNETGAGAEAEKLYQEALETFGRLHETHTDRNDFLARLSVAWGQLGRLHANAGRLNLAEDAFIRARDLGEAAAAEEPQNRDYRDRLAKTHNYLGIVYYQTGRPKEAESAFRHSLDLIGTLAAERPEAANHQADLAYGFNNLGRFYTGAGRLPEALVEHGKARDLLTRLIGRQPSLPEHEAALAMVYQNIAFANQMSGKMADAVKSLTESLHHRERLAQTHPSIVRYQDDLATSHCALGELYRQIGRRVDALKAFEEGRRLREKLVREQPAVLVYQGYLGVLLDNMALLYQETGRFSDAEKSGREAVRILSGLLSTQPSARGHQESLARARANLGSILTLADKEAEAIAETRSAYELYDQLIRRHPEIVEPYYGRGVCAYNMGAYYRKRKQLEEARKAYSQGIDSLEHLIKRTPKLGETARYLYLNRLGRADVLRHLQRHSEAIPDVDRALELPGHLPRESLVLLRAQLCCRAGDHQRALSDMQEVIAMANNPATPVLGQRFYELARVYALAAAAAQRDQKLGVQERAQTADRLAAQAVEFLGRAARAGMFKQATVLEKFKTEADFVPLRTRSDFQSLLTASAKRK